MLARRVLSSLHPSPILWNAESFMRFGERTSRYSSSWRKVPKATMEQLLRMQSCSLRRFIFVQFSASIIAALSVTHWQLVMLSFSRNGRCVAMYTMAESFLMRWQCARPSSRRFWQLSTIERRPSPVRFTLHGNCELWSSHERLSMRRYRHFFVISPMHWSSNGWPQRLSLRSDWPHALPMVDSASVETAGLSGSHSGSERSSSLSDLKPSVMMNRSSELSATSTSSSLRSVSPYPSTRQVRTSQSTLQRERSRLRRFVKVSTQARNAEASSL
mmetsp:Transcript_14624/g.57394  ORF Transcript_14624/g.57394 Transcript_14624/m.57394 type:complete len:273 (-) Transcript_14624:1024-1842(-)